MRWPSCLAASAPPPAAPGALCRPPSPARARAGLNGPGHVGWAEAQATLSLLMEMMERMLEVLYEVAKLFGSLCTTSISSKRFVTTALARARARV